jgi:hypothetical protein
MRKELQEYPFDWMLWRTFVAAARMKAGSEKEYRQAVNQLPYFRGVLDAIYDIGEPGKLFIEMVAEYLEKIIHAKERGQKTAITTFCFSPAVFYALDIVPITLELVTVAMSATYKRGTADFLDYCNEVGFTETSCSSQRGTLGAYLAGNGVTIDMVVADSPGVCDTNVNAFAFASAYLDKPFFQLNMPPDLTGARSTEYHRADYRALISFLEEQTGRELDTGKLRNILEEVGRQDLLMAELEELQILVPNPLPVTFNLLIYAGRFLFAGMPQCTRLLESMLGIGWENAQRNQSGLSSGKESLRGFFCYIDHYGQDLRLWQLLDRMDISYHGNILSKMWSPDAHYVKALNRQEDAYTIDTTDLDTLIDSIADLNSRMPMIKSIRGPYDAPHMWLQDTLALAKLHKADFIVYNGTPGCRNTWGMVKPFARDTEKNGFPTLILYSDAFDLRVESWETTASRIEEFLKVRRLRS